MANAERIGQRGDHGIDCRRVTHACAGTQRRQQVGAARHDFDTTTDGKVGIAQHDGLCRADNGLLGRTAQTVNRKRHRVHRHAALNRGDAGNIGIARIGRNTGADGSKRDLLGIDTGTGDGFLDDHAAKIDGLNILERTAKGTDGRAHRTQYNNFFI